MLGVKAHQLEAKDHRIQVKGYPQRSVHIADVAAKASSNLCRETSSSSVIVSRGFNRDISSAVLRGFSR